MKFVSLSIGDKVVNIQDGVLRNGTIKNVYPIDPPIFAIEFEDGTVEKVLRDNIAIAPKTEIPTEEKTETVEKSEITITPDEFKDITCHIIAEETKSCRALGIAVAFIMGEIHKALFVESEN